MLFRVTVKFGMSPLKGRILIGGVCSTALRRILGRKGDKIRENEDNCMCYLADVIKVMKVVEGAARVGEIRIAYKI